MTLFVWKQVAAIEELHRSIRGCQQLFQKAQASWKKRSFRSEAFVTKKMTGKSRLLDSQMFIAPFSGNYQNMISILATSKESCFAEWHQIGFLDWRSRSWYKSCGFWTTPSSIFLDIKSVSFSEAILKSTTASFIFPKSRHVRLQRTPKILSYLLPKVYTFQKRISKVPVGRQTPPIFALPTRHGVWGPNLQRDFGELDLN